VRKSTVRLVVPAVLTSLLAFSLWALGALITFSLDFLLDDREALVWTAFWGILLFGVLFSTVMAVRYWRRAYALVTYSVWSVSKPSRFAGVMALCTVLLMVPLYFVFGPSNCIDCGGWENHLVTISNPVCADGECTLRIASVETREGLYAWTVRVWNGSQAVIVGTLGGAALHGGGLELAVHDNDVDHRLSSNDTVVFSGVLSGKTYAIDLVCLHGRTMLHREIVP